MAGGSPDIRGRDVFEFGVRQARSIRSFSTEALQDADIHPPYTRPENGQRSRGTPEGGHREGMSHFPGSKL